MKLCPFILKSILLSFARAALSIKVDSKKRMHQQALIEACTDQYCKSSSVSTVLIFEFSDTSGNNFGASVYSRVLTVVGSAPSCSAPSATDLVTFAVCS